MKKLTVNSWVLITILLLFAYGSVVCFSCIHEERNGLLKLKSSFKTDVPLRGWVDDENSDCCGWERVECDNATHHPRVIGLHLNFTYAGGYDVKNVLDASLFTPFQHLQHLDLSNNGIFDFQNEQDLGRLRKLQVLLLNFNNFNNHRSLESLSALTSLRVLDLSDNNINGSFSDFGKGLCKLKNLQEFGLGWNLVSGTIPECFNNLTSLKFLDLSANYLVGSFRSFTPITSLEYLSFSDNQKFDVNFIFTSTVGRFRYLDLSNCNLDLSTTDLVKFLHNQTDLVALHLSNNKLHGAFPNSFFKNNSRLKVLVLRNNSLTGHIHFPVGSDHLDLEGFDVSDNHIQGELQPDIGQVLPKLKKLNMADNDLEGEIPVSLSDMKDLRFLDLSNNNFSGKLPERLGLSCKSLSWIQLSHNKLEGRIPDTLFNSTQLTFLDVGSNRFSGDIPSSNFRSFSLRMLDVSQNRLSGRIPRWLGTNLTTQLVILNMQDNFIEGYIPPQLCNLTSLQNLDLSRNQLSGLMPSCLITMPSLRYLHLQRNKLTDPIPMALPIYNSSLSTLDLSHNNLSGRIPDWFGFLAQLVVLLLKGNHFSGSIPLELCRLQTIGIMDLSHNNLFGSIPPCFTNITFGRITTDILDFSHTVILGEEHFLDDHMFPNLVIQPWEDIDIFQEVVEFPEDVEFMTKSRSNFYKGEIIEYMSGMDLSCNNLEGSIPHDIGALTEIRALNLSHNRFTGVIPSSLSNMKQIESIDLSHNKLSGEIPSSLTRLSFLVIFDVAYNNLSGRVPEMVAQFSTFNETIYEGNPFLCGPPLVGRDCNIDTDHDHATITDTADGGNDMFGIDPISFLVSFAATYVTFLLGFMIVLYINSDWRQRWFDSIDTCLGFVFPFYSKTM